MQDRRVHNDGCCDWRLLHTLIIVVVLLLSLKHLRLQWRRVRYLLAFLQDLAIFPLAIGRHRFASRVLALSSSGSC